MNSNSWNKINITEIYRIRIANIVEKLMQENWAFREKLDKTKVIDEVTQSMQEKFTLEQFLVIEDGELQRRLGQRMATQSLSGLLADLSSKQIQAFDDAVARR